MKRRRYDFEGVVYVDEDILKDIAKEFFEDFGKGKYWVDLNDYLWDYYSDGDNWDRVLDEITDDIFGYYEQLANEEGEEK